MVVNKNKNTPGLVGLVNPAIVIGHWSLVNGNLLSYLCLRGSILVLILSAGLTHFGRLSSR